MQPKLQDPPAATTYEAAATRLGLRRITTVRDELRREAGRELERPLRQAAAVAVLRNPWLDEGLEGDLGPATERIAPILGKLLSDRLIQALGGVEHIEAFGKAALVGLDGELEHAGALIHTPYFGNIVRELLEGTSVLCFADGRSTAGADLRVPLWHKTHATSRKHYQTMDVHLADAPRADEICVIAAASDGPRPFPRIGDRSTDRPITTEILEGLLS
ncbi:amino acid synthesis family protein [Rothia halotolerans]|uniref:amino acid synthesis family protein n=1 Tax=Rothia halotolerans TaxID=405770 RepID=UPI00101CDE2E|nr:amino acid synthesis family protein [Rothia halotolerans]